MKNILFFFCITISLFSCRIETNNAEINIENTVIKGSWKVTHFEKFDSVSTQDYSGYVLHFNNDGSINVEHDETLIEGTWSISDPNPYEDYIQDLKFNLFFTDDPLNKLTNNWDIDFQNNNTLRLVDFSMTSGESILLVLEKV